MKQQKTVESRVLEILKELPDSRGMMICFSFCIITIGYGYIPAGNLPLEDYCILITEHMDFLVLKPYAGQGRGVQFPVFS